MKSAPKTLFEIVSELKSVRTKFASQRLFEHLEKNKQKMYPMKEDTLFRASRLHELCPREEVIANRENFTRIRADKPDLQIIFEIGNLFHDLYRNRLFGPMGEWRGAWQCMGCGWSTDDDGSSCPPKPGDPGKVAKMPSECPKCNRSADEHIVFKEWELIDKQLGLIGHADGWIVSNGSERILVDLKSNSPRTYGSIANAKQDHVIQVLSYMYMATDKHGQVWYMNKAPWGDCFQFIKEKDVKWDKKQFDLLIKEPLDIMREGLLGGKIPKRICITKDTPKAKECQLCKICFKK